MSGQKKFGAFDGVFTPSILTILGVIMYLRMGWVVGNAGLWGTIIIVLIAHIISFSTGLSISSISTDKKVGAGGVYYVLSRSLGLPIGGAIGLTLFVGTALSISLYLIGFSESFNAYLGLNTGVNGLRSTGSLFLLVLTVIALISTSVAIKTQFFILAAIIISLVSIFAGGGAPATDAVPAFGGEGVASMETVFAIFFPAVTGFTAGIAMSGDLKDPKKDLPLGTIAAISVGLVVYIALAFFISTKVEQDRLLTDYNVLTEIAYFGPAVIAGVWGATLSSAIGGILGGPRILQAMSLDRITPRLFGKGTGLNNEPRNALILTVLISEAGILIGELDLIARIVSMFYLAAYGFINISFFLESWASSDFKPSFKVSRWIGLTGFIATFAVMFKLDMIAMIAAFVIIGGVFLWLQRKQISLGTGDVWQSVWSTVVKSGLKRMEAAEDHKRNWKPNIILFSGDAEARPHLIEFGKALAGQAGVVTNFDLIENKKAKVLFPKHKQSVSDELLQKHGVFGRRIEVNNLYEGMETIATTFGFSGLDPNTVLMGWARNTQNPVFFTQMTEKLIALDYNVLYLDYDKRWGFRKRRQIDMWWRGISNNAELMMHLARFISTSPSWRNATIRVLLVNDFNVDRRIIEKRIQMLLDEFRVQAEIKVINNAVDRKPFYKLMKTISAEADLVLIGIPKIEEGQEASFVRRTNDLVGIIGTTLLVKASSTFETTKLGLKELEDKQEYQPEQQLELIPLPTIEDDSLSEIAQLIDDRNDQAITRFCESGPSILQQHYRQWINEQEKILLQLLSDLKQQPDNGFRLLQQSLSSLASLSYQFRDEEIDILKGVLAESLEEYQKQEEEVLNSIPKKVKSNTATGKKVSLPMQKAFRQILYPQVQRSLYRALLEMGTANAKLLANCNKEIRELSQRLCLGLSSDEPWETTLKALHTQLQHIFEQLQPPVEQMVENLDYELRNAHRLSCKFLFEAASADGFKSAIKKKSEEIGKKETKEHISRVQSYAQYWPRNQELFHRNYEASLQLTHALVRLNEEKELAIQRLQNDYVSKVQAGIHQLQAATGMVRQKLESEGDKEWEPLPLHQEEDHDNTEAVLWRFTDASRALSHLLPQQVELMDENSRNNFTTEQASGVTAIKLRLAEIAAYIIDYHFTTPFQKQLLQLRQQLNQVSGSANNYGSLLNYGLEAIQEDRDYQELSAILQKADQELKRLEESASNIFQAAEAEIKEKYEATAAMLNVESIVLRSEELSQHVRKENRRRGLVEWREWVERGVSSVQQEVSTFISDKREEVINVEFERAHEAVRSDQGRLRSYREAIGPGQKAATLPFYYRQLFSGRHLNLNKKANSRQVELDMALKAIRYHRQGLEGAILITGQPLSGKSYLLEYIARHLLEGPIFRVVPPLGGSVAPRALQKAFEQATNTRGSLESILEEMPEGSSFLIEDIELWWMQPEEGGRPLTQLIEVIQLYSQRHYFLLSVNIEALKRMRAHSDIDQALLSTIILSPVSPDFLQQILWSRHHTGGIPLYVDGKDIAELSSKEWQSVVSRLHKSSGGNIGLALWHWLGQIDASEEQHFLFDPHIESPDFPELEDTSWYFILLQLYLHKSLSRRRFQLLFSTEPKEWIDRRINELKKANILVPHGGDILELHPLVRHQLGQLLKERGLL